MKKLIITCVIAMLSFTAMTQDREVSGSRINGETINPDGIILVYVEGTGSGIMDIPGFYIGKYEVTQAQWQYIMGRNPSKIKDEGLPVSNVSWNEVQEFITLLNIATGKNYRLPTDTEWMFAARGGISSKGFQYSGSNNIRDVGWYKKNTKKSPQAGGQRRPMSLAFMI